MAMEHRLIHPKAATMRIVLWGGSAQMTDRERKRLLKSIRSNAQIPESEPIEFVTPTEQDITKANTKSKRGGVDGG